MKNDIITIQLDEQGHLILPQDVLQKYGLVPGSVSRVEISEYGLALSHSSDRLDTVYVEPTNTCNLDCLTCMRNVWKEPLGKMSTQTFEKIMQGVQSITPPPKMFFGGFGEPLAHANIREMVASARKICPDVELITNGTLLDETTAHWMIRTGLSRLWVSIDGASPKSYSDVRLGDALPVVISNLKRLQDLKNQYESPTPKLGIAFVAMKRNLADLPEVIRLGKRLGADRFSISNVFPHTSELRDEALYTRSMCDTNLQPSPWSPDVSLPRLDFDEQTLKVLAEVFKDRNTIQITRQTLGFGVYRCPFLEKRSVSIRWDGAISPCLPLLHTHTSFLAENQRTSHAYSVGNINDQSLVEVWKDPNYVQLRKRLLTFDFSPCTFCNSCDMAENNLEDCFGNPQPTCGGCLWAQGFIQCP